jgi:hypothetical protein
MAAKKKTAKKTGKRITEGNGSAGDNDDAKRMRETIRLDSENMRITYIERALDVGRRGSFNMDLWVPYVLKTAGIEQADIARFYPRAQLQQDETQDTTPAPEPETAAAAI